VNYNIFLQEGTEEVSVKIPLSFFIAAICMLIHRMPDHVWSILTIMKLIVRLRLILID